MARSRSNGGAYAWALVVFGCGFVVSLLVAIIFYTKIKQAEDSKVVAENALAVYVDADDDADLRPWIDSSAAADGSTFRVMLSEINRLREDLDFKNKQIERLNNDMVAVNTQVEREKDTIEQRELELQSQQADAAAALEEAMDRARQIEARLQAVSQERDELSDLVQTSLRSAGDASVQQITGLNQQLAALNIEMDDAADMIEAQRGRIAYLEQLKNDLILPDVTTPDGEVLSVFSSGGQLFINRGRSQGIMLGLTFEIFGPNEVISLSEVAARGKATIEVFDVQDDTATCRVVRTSRGAQVVAGDVIANIVYDPNKEFTFYAFGNFDIEYDGGTNDIGRIQNLVTEWGGILAQLQNDENELPILSPEIDFLVLGAQPLFPDPPGETLDPEVIAAWQAQVREFETYTALLDDAKKLRIPVLNQNRFLDLVGYYVR